MPEPRRPWPRSFRSRILLLVLAVGVAPLALLGFWLAGSAARSGEALLVARLTDALELTARDAAGRWIRARSDLLDWAEYASGSTPPALLAGRARAPAGAPSPLVARFVVTWVDGRPPAVVRAADTEAGAEVISVTLPLYARSADTILGSLTADLAPDRFFRPVANVPGLAGVVLAAFHPETGRPLLRLPFEPELLASDRFTWGGEAWLARRRALAEPPVLLVAAAPVAPFTEPFIAATRRGTALLVLTGVAGLALALLATGRLTRSLERLAVGADAVAAGDLDRRVEPGDVREVQRVAHAFNTMTLNLRRTLHELARREAQAAAGEFAASLAHEVRNPLTAIRVDLQVVEERLPEGSPLRETQARALEEIVRLDRTVGEALARARHGGLGTRQLDVHGPLAAALHAAAPTFRERGVALPPIAIGEAVMLRGEPGALEQLFLNLLLNAAQAVSPGGDVQVRVHAEQDEAVVCIADNGPGIPAESRGRIFEPFFSTRPDGTGLGLPIARRIAEAHGGSLTLTSRAEGGTSAEVRLPLAR